MPSYRRSFLGWTAGVLLLAITGCAQDGTPAGLCPSCAAFGGETGDFPGGSLRFESCPDYDLVPADGELVLESGLRAAVAKQFVERDLLLPAAWRYTHERYDGSAGGFSEQTALRAHIEVTGINALQRSSVRQWSGDAVAEAACGGLVFSVRITLESEDGAIVGSFEEGRADVYSETEAQIRAGADVKQFTGSLELTAPGEPLVEQLEIYLGERGARGRVTTAQGFEDGSVASPFLELRAGADDSCEIYAFPYDGADATTRTEDIMSALAATSPYRAFYDHRDVGGPAVRLPTTPEETEVSVEFGAPVSVCQGRGFSEFGQRWSSQGISFDVPAHLRTADARYELSAVLHTVAVREADGDFGQRVGADFSSELLTSSELLERFGVDVSSSGAECAALSLHQSLDGSNRLSVWGGSCTPPVGSPQLRVEVLKLAQ